MPAMALLRTNLLLFACLPAALALQLARQAPELAAAALAGESAANGPARDDRWPVACAAMLSIMAMYYGYILIYLYSDYSAIAATEGTDKHAFSTYIAYRFSYWYVWTAHAMLRVLGIVSVSLWLSITLLYHLSTNSPNGVFSFQRVGYSLMAPDAGLGANSTHEAIILFFSSIFGLCIFALLVAAFQDSFNHYLEALKQGTSPAVETNHVLIIGFSQETPALIQTICDGCQSVHNQDAISVVVLAEQPKTEVEEIIKAKTHVDRGKSKVVVRNGKGYMTADLKHVSAASCSTIILSPDYSVPKEQRDALVLRSLLVLVAEGWPRDGRIVLVCSLKKNYNMLQRIGGHHTTIIMVDSFISDLMVQSSKGLGLGKTITETFTLDDGNELYVVDAPKQLVGLSLFEVSAHFSEAVLFGLWNETPDEKGAAIICPDKSRVLKEDDALVMYALTSSHTSNLTPIAAIPPDLTPIAAPTSPASRKKSGTPETIFIMGWNESVGLTMIECDDLIPPGSQVVTFCTIPVAEREAFLKMVQVRWSKQFKNITKITHVVGTLGSRSSLDALPQHQAPPIESASRIFLLWDNSLSPQEADATMVCTILQIRNMLEVKGVDPRKVNIVPEVGDVETENFCTRAGVIDFVNVEALRSGIIAMIALQPRLNQVYHEMHNIHFERRGLKDYLPEGQPVPAEVTFFDAMCIMRNTKDVLIGWSIGEECESGDRPQILASLHKVEENPPKLERKKWVEGRDSLIVITDRNS